MKITTLLLFSACLSASAGGIAQKVTLSLKNVKLEKVFKEIREQTGYVFFYDAAVLDGVSAVNVRVKDASVEEILKEALDGQPLDFSIERKTITIIRKQPIKAPPAIVLATFIPPNIIAGTVKDKSGSPLAGVSVILKGTKRGSTSKTDGSFSIEAEKGDVLEFSIVGYQTKSISVGSSTTMSVQMEEQIAQVSDEIILVGYGTQKKQAVTGAVVQANLKTYENVASNNIIERVKGTVAGLNVGGTNTAGGLASFTIRGTNSINAGSAPLIVVDGAIFRGTLNDIPASDIADLTVLKDASAAAVYGSRSANGVILIATKSGTGVNGKPNLDVNLSYGTSNELTALKVYDGPGYLQRLLDIREAQGLVADPLQVGAYLQNEEAKNYNATPDHAPTLADPHSLFSQTGNLINTTVSYSQRANKTSYYISGNYVKQNGVIKNDIYKHYSARVNVETNVTDWLKLGIKAYYSLKDYPGRTIYGLSTGASSSSTYQFSPYATLKDANGNYIQFPQTTTSFNSPYWQIPDALINNQHNLNGIFNATVKVPWVKGLSYNLTYSNNLNMDEQGTFFGKRTVTGLPKNGSGDLTYNRSYAVLLDQIIKYNRGFGKHNVDVTLLYSTEDYKFLTQSTHGEGFDNAVLGLYGLSKANTQTVNTGASKTAALGEMARVTYGYNKRYTLTGTVRRDGFSAFSTNYKYAVFPSLGANWNITNESFFNNVRTINNLALRASYGSNGNQAISPYGTLARISNGRYYYGGSSYVFTQQISTLGNENLQWESVNGLNIGLDFSVVKSRINGSLDWYSKYTKNLIFPLSIPSTSGFTTISSNLGRVANKGIEISLSTINIDKKDFTWRSDFVFARNRNKIVHIYGPDSTGVEKDLISQGYFIGKSLGTIYDYKVIGMWQQSEKDNGTIMTGMVPGSYKLLDVNNDGKITSENDRVFIGNTQQRYQWSLTNTFRYKDFTLMAYLYSIWGGNGYYLSSTNTPYNDGYAGNGAINHTVYDYWTPTNTGAEFPRLNYNTTLVAYHGIKYFDRSFIKLQKISLTYDLTRHVSRYGVKGMNFSLSADNLLTYAPHWKGLDPETDNGLTDRSIPSIRTIMGVLMLNL